MSQSVPTNTPETQPGSFLFDPWALSLAYLSLRFWLGSRALFAGLGKFSEMTLVKAQLLDEFGKRDISGTLITVERKVYGLAHYHGIPSDMKAKLSADPFVPDWFLNAYAASLGPLLILAGIMLCLGIASRSTLFTLALLYTSLTLGSALLNDQVSVATLGLQVSMCVLALLLVRYDRYCLTRCW